MRIHADLQLEDIPGRLVNALAPIADYGGNIVGIMHSRERVVDGRITVRLIFDVKNEKPLKMLIKEWEKKDVYIARIEEIYRRVEKQFLVMGEDRGAKINELIGEISNLDEVNVSDLKMISREKGYAALITVDAGETKTLERAEKILESLAEKILLVKGV